MANDSETLHRRIAELTSKIRQLRQQFQVATGRRANSARRAPAIIGDQTRGGREKAPRTPAKKR